MGSKRYYYVKQATIYRKPLFWGGKVVSKSFDSRRTEEAGESRCLLSRRDALTRRVNLHICCSSSVSVALIPPTSLPVLFANSLFPELHVLCHIRSTYIYISYFALRNFYYYYCVVDTCAENHYLLSIFFYYFSPLSSGSRGAWVGAAARVDRSV